MLTYRIAPHKAPHKTTTPHNYLQKEHILARQIERCGIHVGDWIKVKIKRGGYRPGVIIDLIDDVTEVEWKCGTQPYFIRVQLPIMSIEDGEEIYCGDEIACVPLKKVRK